jgi:hypothetical protein
LWLAAACAPAGDGTGVPAGVETVSIPPPTVTAPPSTVPTEPAYPKPTAISMSCAETENVLRPSCHVDVEPAQPVQITVARADGSGVARVHASDLVATAHDLALYFMAPDTDHVFTAAATTWPDELTAEVVHHTGTPPDVVGSWLEMTGTSTLGLIGANLACSTSAVAVIYDTYTGDLAWYQLLDAYGGLGVDELVHFLPEGTVFAETGTALVEVDVHGNPLMDLRFGVDYTDALHHDVAKLGDVVYGLVSYFPDPGDPSLWIDAVTLIDANSGAEIDRFRPHEELDIPDSAAGDYTHANTVTVDPDGDIHVSWLTQATLLKIDGQTGTETFGDPIWIVGNGAFEPTHTLDFSMVGGLDYFGFQHSLTLRADGRILVLDNQSGRGLSIALDDTEMRALVDAEYPTVEESCGPQGTAVESAGGNVVVACWGDWVREYDGITADLLWEAKVECRLGDSVGVVRWTPLDSWNDGG